jgi:hypothetical protein
MLQFLVLAFQRPNLWEGERGKLALTGSQDRPTAPNSWKDWKLSSR